MYTDLTGKSDESHTKPSDAILKKILNPQNTQTSLINEVKGCFTCNENDKLIDTKWLVTPLFEHRLQEESSGRTLDTTEKEHLWEMCLEEMQTSDEVIQILFEKRLQDLPKEKSLTKNEKIDLFKTCRDEVLDFRLNSAYYVLESQPLTIQDLQNALLTVVSNAEAKSMKMTILNYIMQRLIIPEYALDPDQPALLKIQLDECDCTVKQLQNASADALRRVFDESINNVEEYYKIAFDNDTIETLWPMILKNWSDLLQHNVASKMATFKSKDEHSLHQSLQIESMKLQKLDMEHRFILKGFGSPSLKE